MGRKQWQAGGIFSRRFWATMNSSLNKDFLETWIRSPAKPREIQRWNIFLLLPLECFWFYDTNCSCYECTHCHHARVILRTRTCSVPQCRTSCSLGSMGHQMYHQLIHQLPADSNRPLPLHFHGKKYLCFCLCKLQFEEIQFCVIKECPSLEWVLPGDN